MELFDRLYWMRHGCGVQRFHHEKFVGERQNVGHHSAGVALLLLEALGDKCSRNLLIAALQHDLAEGFTGDTPAPTKWALGSEIFDAYEERIRKELGIVALDLTEEERAWLHAADFLECCWTVWDQQRLGNTDIDRVMRKLIARQADLCIVDVHPMFLQLYNKIMGAWRHCARREHPFQVQDPEGW